MNILLIILTVCFFIFLYNLYYVSKQDFVIARKDIAIDKIFNIAFFSAVLGIFFARLFYVIFHPEPQFLSLLGFIAFPYFPGLSLIGGLTGSILSLGVISRLKKLPIGKIIDLFSVSFLGVMPFGFLFFFIVKLGKTDIIFNTLFVSSIFISLIFIKLIYRFSEKGEIKDGSFTLIFLSLFSLIYFLVKLFTDLVNFSFFSFENITLFIIIFASLILLVNHEIMEKVLEKK